MRRLVILLDLAVLRGPGREQELQRLGVAIARAWGVYFQAGTSWGYELYDSTSSVHLLRPTLRRTAASLSKHAQASSVAHLPCGVLAVLVTFCFARLPFLGLHESKARPGIGTGHFGPGRARQQQAKGARARQQQS